MPATSIYFYLLAYFDISFNHKGKRLELCCPFHHDINPSAAVYHQDDSFHCWACEITLSPVKFVAKYLEVSQYEAEEFLASKFNYTFTHQIKDRILITTERKQCEKFLRERTIYLTYKEHAKYGELLDKIFWCYVKNVITEVQFKKALIYWREQCSNHRQT